VTPEPPIWRRSLPLREPASQEPAIGEVLAVLLGSTGGLAGLAGLAAAGRLGGGPRCAR
jgi:hypothetical protein